MTTRSNIESASRSEEQLLNSDKLKDLLLNNLSDFGRSWENALPLFLSFPLVARVLWYNEVYRLALNVPGRMLEFGSHWGSSLNIFMLLKMIYEPWNVSRPIVSFSLFSQGFSGVDAQDIRPSAKGSRQALPGDFSTSENWKEKLEQILKMHATPTPIDMERNFQIVEGDVCHTFPDWLKENPEALVSHAHFDLDVYRPTREVLQQIIPRMPKGAVMIFDELNCPLFPGETLAVHEVLGINNLSLRKSVFRPYSAYCIVE